MSVCLCVVAVHVILCEGPYLLDQLRLNFRKTCILGRGGRDF